MYDSDLIVKGWDISHRADSETVIRKNLMMMALVNEGNF
jgi:hypothetical protein